MFQAGFARLDVTPPLGNPIAGYPRERIADGVLDPIELNTLAVSDGENTLLVYACDFIYITDQAAAPIRKLIAEKTGVPENHVLLHGLHQHTTLRIGNREGMVMAHTVKDKAYLDVLYRKFCDAGNLAIADLAEAKISVGQKETGEPISFIRRYRMKDGSSRTNPGCLNPDVVAPIGEADNTVRVVRFRRDKGDIALVNFCTHPDVIGGNKYSADWPGFARRITEEVLPGVHCLVMNGPQGDTNHVDVSKPAIKEPEARYANSRRMGQIISDTAVSIWDQLREVKSEGMFGDVRVEFVPTNRNGIEKIAEMQKKKADFDAGLIGKMNMGDRSDMTRICDLQNEFLFRKGIVTVFCFGEVALVGFGGEPFTRYGAAARAAAPEMFVVALCCTNGGEGYMPDQSAYAEGGYGVTNSRFSPQVADQLQGCAKKMLDEYRAK